MWCSSPSAWPQRKVVEALDLVSPSTSGRVVCMAGLAPHVNGTGEKGSDEHSPMPSDHTG